MDLDVAAQAAGTLFAALERRARAAPGRTALAAPSLAPLSYGELALHVDATGLRLRELGIGRGDRVAMALRNGPAMAAALLAVAGAATCAPLDPRCRADELAFLLADLAVRAVIVDADGDAPARSVARDLGIDVIELAVERGRAAGLFTLHGRPRPSHDGRPVRPDDIALLLHTSGTTSRPKLVPLLHRNLAASARAIAVTLALGECDRGLCAMPLFHIHGIVAGLLAPLAAGSSVACAGDFSAASFYACVDELQPTWYTAVPAIHQAILAHAPRADAIVARSRLRFVRSSSAPLSPTVMAELEALFRAPVVEAYGMTEAAHQIASNPLPPLPRKPGSVGLPAGARIAIVDEAGRPVAPGGRGEVVIRGPSLMPGYANAGPGVAGAFVDGWFRTGDEGSFDADGYLTLTGRLKDIVNRGGEKVSPREVDDLLAAHPAIARAVAFAVPHATLGEDLAAAVVLRPGASADEQALRDWLRRRVADVKVPSRIVLVDDIPAGATGKVARAELASALADRLGNAQAPARDPIETVVVGVVRDVLGHDGVGVNDNFFALGGDSLQAAEVTMRLQAIFGVELGGAALFRLPSVAELAGFIRAHTQS